MEPDYGSISKTLRVNKTDTNQFQAIILSKSSKYHFKQNHIPQTTFRMTYVNLFDNSQLSVPVGLGFECRILNIF